MKTPEKWVKEQRCPEKTDWIPLTMDNPPPEGVRFWVKLENGCEHYATRIGKEIHVGVPAGFKPKAAAWRPDDEAPHANLARETGQLTIREPTTHHPKAAATCEEIQHSKKGAVHAGASGADSTA